MISWPLKSNRGHVKRANSIWVETDSIVTTVDEFQLGESQWLGQTSFVKTVVNERYNKLWYSPDGATAIRVILLMRCSGRHWQPKQKQTWNAVLRTQMQ